MTRECSCGCGCSPTSELPVTCGCCEGTHAATPLSVANRPGLDALVYRVGTHGSFLATMLTRLSGPDAGALHELTARTGDDGAIALLDAWATVGDVLTFYQERIANEGFLRTATERRSILEASRLVGYELRPGVAASTFLAYTLDKDLTGKDTYVTIPKGTRAQSVPGPDELPQPFETSSDFDASSAWNNLKPRAWRPPRITAAQAAALEELYLEGVTTNLKAGDLVLLLFGPRVQVRVALKVKAVTPLQIVPDPPGPPTSRTLVTFQRPSREALGGPLSELRQILDPESGLRNLGRHELERSAIAVETERDVLAPLHGLVSDDAPPKTVAAKLKAALDTLRERLAFSDARGHERLSGWLSEAIAGLETPLAGLTRLLPAVLAPARRPAAFAEDADAGSAVAGIAGLLRALELRSPVQPASSRELVRSQARLFGPGSDLGPRLLRALNPSLSDSLYSAWARASLSPASTLNSAHALRVRAAPFGATAPLRPVLDSSGRIVASEEWPLAGALKITARLVIADGWESLELQAETQDILSRVALPFQAGSDETVRLRPGEAQVEMEESRITVRFTDGLAEGGLLIIAREGDRLVVRPAGGGQVSRVRPGDALRWKAGGRRFAIDFRELESGRAMAMSVTSEILLPPKPRNLLALDSQYDQIVRGSWVVVDRGDGEDPVVRRVTAVETVVKTAYGLSAKVTQLTLGAAWLRPDDLLLSAIRTVTVYAQSEQLELALEPVDDDVYGSTIELEELHDGLETGRWIIVEGERTDIPGVSGVTAAEVAMLAGVAQRVDETRPGDTVHTVLTLARPLAFSYRRPTVKIWGNVGRATHGETRAEILGSGDAAKPFQELALRNAPLTYLASENPLGAESTLEVRVDQALWREADSLALLGPSDRRYVLRTDEADRATVVFGDGRKGARLPTGIDNVVGEYRTGVGRGGNVEARQISQLQSRPLGVSGVVNPLPATGGADRDSLDQARRNTPLGVKALDRLISVRDYEDFVLARAGIGKASAREISDGLKTVVHVTIAGAGDVPVDESSDLFRALRGALAESGDPSQPVEVAVRELIFLVIAAGVGVHPDYRWADVEPQVRLKLLDRFGFDRRELGQDVVLSEVQSVVQSVRGVVSVDVDVLAGVRETVSPEELAEIGADLSHRPETRLGVELARYDVQRHTVGAGESLIGIADRYGVTLGELLRLNPSLAGPNLAGLVGTGLVVSRGIRPAQLAVLSPEVPDTLVLREVKA